MDKHYGWQEGRGTQGQSRPQNGQRWNERNRDDDRDMRGMRGGEYDGGWDRDDRRWTSSGADLDRDDYVSEGDQYGSPSRGSLGRASGRWGQSSSYRERESSGQFGSAQGYGNQRFGGDQGFSGGHYGGFANEGYPGQGNYGGNRGFANPGYSGPAFPRQGSGGTYQGRGFAGRGPKGYQRSDDRVKEQLCDRLMDDDDIDASEITVDVKNGEVTLTGSVGSREEKRAAEAIAEQAPGVRDVQNLLRVSQDATSDRSTQSGRTSSGQTGQSKTRATERE